MENTRIILVRHGESLGNMNNLALGHENLDLSPRGYEQARATAEFLRGERIDAIYSSDLLRAHNTAAANAELRGLQVNDCEQLREIYLGDWEGRCIDDIVEKDPEGLNGGWKNNFGVFAVPGGESVPEARERFYNAVLEIVGKNIGKTILIAAHAGVIRAFWAKIKGVKPENVAKEVLYPTNASCSYIDFDGEKLIPREYSVDAHLAAVGVLPINF